MVPMADVPAGEPQLNASGGRGGRDRRRRPLIPLGQMRRVRHRLLTPSSVALLILLPSLFSFPTASAWQRWTLPAEDTFTFGCPHGQTETQLGCNKDTGTEVPIERHGHSMNTWVGQVFTIGISRVNDFH